MCKSLPIFADSLSLKCFICIVILSKCFCYVNGYENRAKVQRIDDICGIINGRRLYLEAGEKGVLRAENVTDHDTSNSNNLWRHDDAKGSNITFSNPYRKCSVELITCPSCVISVKFEFLNVSKSCNNRNSATESCGCDYAWAFEPGFEDKSGEQFCGLHNASSNLVTTNKYSYTSETRALAIQFVFNSSYANAFTIHYSSERNRRFINGYPKRSEAAIGAGVATNKSNNNNDNSSQFIASPFFPNEYLRDLSVEYVINCRSVEKCRIRLIFSDFQLSQSSIFEFFDWNGQRLDVATGSAFRPPIIMSTGPTMVVRFYANGGFGQGYKAFYSFILGDAPENNTETINTNCGGFVSNLGGAITMMNMMESGTSFYDCFWIIQPPKTFYHLKTHISLRLSTLEEFDGNAELLIKEGTTSAGSTLDAVRYPLTSNKKDEHIVLISTGFYVSLKGSFSSKTRFALVYSSFNYNDCYSGSDFLCANNRCVVIYLSCDGFNHCGDNSDESDACLEGPDGTPNGRRWYSVIPNYYFPKLERYGDVKTTALIFSTCSLVLISVILTLIFLICRINAKSRTERHYHDQIQTITQLIEEEHDGMQSGTSQPDEPPNYEAPPDYDQIAEKFEHKCSTRKLKRTSSRRKRSVTSYKRRCSCTNSTSTNVSCSSTVNTPSSLSGDGGSEENRRIRQFSCSISETPTNHTITSVESSVINLFSVEGSDTSSVSILIPRVSVAGSCRSTPIPQSPPPAYSRIFTISDVCDSVRNSKEPTITITSSSSSEICNNSTSEELDGIVQGIADGDVVGKTDEGIFYEACVLPIW